VLASPISLRRDVKRANHNPSAPQSSPADYDNQGSTTTPKSAPTDNDNQEPTELERQCLMNHGLADIVHQDALPVTAMTAKTRFHVRKAMDNLEKNTRQHISQKSECSKKGS
jgi:hypothetical protein